MTITPSRLNNVTDAATLLALVQSNFTLLAEDIAKRVATYQNGNPITIIGPPTSGARVLNEFWRHALGGEWRCTGWARQGRGARSGRRSSGSGWVTVGPSGRRGT